MTNFECTTASPEPTEEGNTPKANHRVAELIARLRANIARREAAGMTLDEAWYSDNAPLPQPTINQEEK
jgi:hypothetical protein